MNKEAMRTPRLQLAIYDNIEWCTAICNSHDARILTTEQTWANLLPSPRYYPNIITRLPAAQMQVTRQIKLLRQQNPQLNLAIKDSFADLDLRAEGFDCIINGDWYGGYLRQDPHDTADDWQMVQSAEQLENWEIAWGGDGEKRIFHDSLLHDPRIKFWFRAIKGQPQSGFITFQSLAPSKHRTAQQLPEPCIGISNWFAVQNSRFQLNLTKNLSASFHGLPVVFWQTPHEAINISADIAMLGPMRVWVSSSVSKI